MENATNGLIMAGSVLIGVIVLSLFVYLFSSMGTTAKEFQEEMDKTSVLKFNEPFEKYMGREDLTPHDVLTIYNLVKERNQEAGYDIIDINGVNIGDEAEFLISGKKYKWEVNEDDDIYSEETQRIEKIKLKEVRN